MYMKLQELSQQYSTDAERFAQRIRELEAQLQQEGNRANACRLRQRIDDLRPMLRQSRTLARLTQHYYDRGYHRHDTYRL